MNEHAGHRDRVKKEFLKHGFPQGTPPHKVLELLLFFCVQRSDTNPLAHQLINKYKTIAGVLDAPIEELAEFKGLTVSSATLLKLIMPIARIYCADKEDATPQFTSLDEIGDFILNKYIGVTKERASILLLNHRNQVIDFQFLSEGDVSSVAISNRDIIKRALNRDAAALVLAHNHPNGIAIPSRDDISTTERLSIALASTGIALLDHIIVAEMDFVSLAQSYEYSHIFGMNNNTI